MIRRGAALWLVIAIAACGAPPVVVPSPAPASATATALPNGGDEATDVVFLAKPGAAPVPFGVNGAGNGDTAEARIRSRIAALGSVNDPLADGSRNAFAFTTARLGKVRVGGGLAMLDFTVATGDWGLGPMPPSYFLQQLVFTVTVEAAAQRVLVTQDGGRIAVIGGVGVPWSETRASVMARDEHRGGVYLARDLEAPLRVIVGGAGRGDTVEARVRSRMQSLATAPPPAAMGAFNALSAMKARLATVTVTGDLARLDYAVPPEGWGIDGSAALRAFVQQVVFTATEEPGIARVLVTENGGKVAVVGGEGLVIDRPQTREGLGPR